VVPILATDASSLARRRGVIAANRRSRSSTFLARTRHMTLRDALDRLSSFLPRTVSRTATVMIGFAMTIVGLGVMVPIVMLPLGMTATIVLLPLGVVTGLLGVAVFLGGAIDG